MDKHTPTPWLLNGCEAYCKTNLQGRKGEAALAVFVRNYAISPEQQAANAEYAVKAVNSHASLTEAVRVLTEALEHAKRQIQHPDQMIDEAFTTAKELTK